MPSIGTMTGPGTVTITDDTSLAVIAQTTAIVAALTKIQGIPATPLPGTLVTIDANLFAIQKNLGRIADLQQSISGSLSKVNIAVGSLATAQASSNVLQAAMVANQVQTNNYTVAATEQTLEATGQPAVVVKPPLEQLQKVVKDAVEFNGIAAAQGAVTNFITGSAKDIGTWVTQTKVYTTAAKWLEDAIDNLVSILPDSLKTSKTSTEAAAGIKNPV
jgi:hypothetical protein